MALSKKGHKIVADLIFSAFIVGLPAYMLVEAYSCGNAWIIPAYLLAGGILGSLTIWVKIPKGVAAQVDAWTKQHPQVLWMLLLIWFSIASIGFAWFTWETYRLSKVDACLVTMWPYAATLCGVLGTLTSSAVYKLIKTGRI